MTFGFPSNFALHKLRMFLIGTALVLGALAFIVIQKHPTFTLSSSGSLKGSLTDIGTKGDRTVTQITFDAGEISATLPENNLNIIVTPDAADISDGARLSDVITSGKRILGYKYTSASAALEIEAKERADNGEPVTFSEFFTGQFFASDEARNDGDFMTDFEAQKNISFLPLAEVKLERSARYVMVTMDQGTELTVRRESECGNGTMDAGEECDDGQFNGLSGMCNNACTSLEPEISTINDSIETYMSSSPVNLLSVMDRADFMPRHFADLHVKGISENPSFEIEADVSYGQGGWQIKNIITTPEGFSGIPFFVLNEDIHGGAGGGMQRFYLAVRNNGTSEYPMRWQITGQGTPHVRPVLLSHMSVLNYLGNKKILVMKGRITSNVPSEPSWNTTLNRNLEGLKVAFRNNSNGRANLFFDVRETYHQPSFDPSTVRCYEKPILLELMTGFLSSIGVSFSNYLQYHYEGSIFTMHDDSINLFAGCIQTHAATGMVDCPQCPRYAMVGPESNNVAATMLHEFGHELYIGHPTLNNYCGQNDTAVITESEIFGSCAYQLQQATPPILIQNRPVPNDIMGTPGDTGASYGILMRAQLGWLMGAQVKLVTEPGLYNVYSDHNDRTSDPSKPLILQILVKRNGVPDYVFITVPNIRREVPFPVMSDLERDYGSYYSDGIQLHGYYNGTEIVYGPLNNIDTQDAAYKTTLLPHQKVTLLWPGTNISIELLERTGEEATVKIGE